MFKDRSCSIKYFVAFIRTVLSIMYVEDYIVQAQQPCFLRPNSTSFFGKLYEKRGFFGIQGKDLNRHTSMVVSLKVFLAASKFKSQHDILFFFKTVFSLEVS